MIVPVAQKHLLQRTERRGGSDSKSAQAAIGAQASQEDHDDLFRPVFGVLGIPLDALNLDALLCRIGAAIASRKPFLLSTPNVNLLMLSRTDREFRESLLFSDACPIDGMPLVWIARLFTDSCSRPPLWFRYLRRSKISPSAHRQMDGIPVRWLRWRRREG